LGSAHDAEQGGKRWAARGGAVPGKGRRVLQQPAGKGRPAAAELEQASSWATSGSKAKQAENEREGGSKEDFLFFSFQIFQSHFKMDFEILLKFSNRAHNMKYYAVACMLNHVASLIVAFNLVRVITFLSLHAHKMRNQIILSYLETCKF
jgi:hypothetical protein